MTEMAAGLDDVPEIAVPAVYAGLSTPRVLVMEELHGVSVSAARPGQPQVDERKLADILLRSALRLMMGGERFRHARLNPARAQTERLNRAKTPAAGHPGMTAAPQQGLVQVINRAPQRRRAKRLLPAAAPTSPGPGVTLATVSALIVCASVSPYGNTRHVAQAMAPVLSAQITAPGQVTAGDVTAHQLAGFGSGIYSFTYHPQLWRLTAALRPAPGAAAFVFSISGGPAALFWPSTRLLIALLARRGYQIIGSFSCRGAYDWGSLPLPAGNTGHPDTNDQNTARERATAWRARAQH